MADAPETSTETLTTETTAAPANDVAAVETSALGGAGGDTADTTATTDGTVETTAKADGDTASAPATIPEAYELAAPEGLTIDPKDIEAATPVFKEIGLSNDQANKLMPVAAQFAQGIADKIAAEQLSQVAAWRKDQFAAAQADPEIGGAKWDESLTLAAKALDTFGATKGSSFRNVLDESGWGNHPEMIRMFSKIGRAVGEDSDFVRGDTAAKTNKPIWDRIYDKPAG